MNRRRGLEPRDEARLAWLELSGIPKDAGLHEPLTPETMDWLRRTAIKMLAADAQPAETRREAAFEASGLKGPSGLDDAREMLDIELALDEYHKGPPPGISPAEYVAQKLGWDPDHSVAPDSHRKRITRLADSYFGKGERVRALLKRR